MTLPEETEILFEPMPGKIAVNVSNETELQRGGLILLRDPNHSRIGEVVAVYEPFNLHIDKPTELTEPYVQVGDLVVFGRHNGVEVTVHIEGIRKRVIILTEKEILTKVRIQKRKEPNGTENS